jgi:hypothetical protein
MKVLFMRANKKTKWPRWDKMTGSWPSRHSKPCYQCSPIIKHKPHMKLLNLLWSHFFKMKIIYLNTSKILSFQLIMNIKNENQPFFLLMKCSKSSVHLYLHYISIQTSDSSRPSVWSRYLYLARRARDRVSLHVAQPGLETAILLSLPPECWEGL